MLVLSGLCEGRARGVLSLHTAPPPVPKTPASNSCVPITSKLIENKPLQVLYSGHLRKTGGGGVPVFLSDHTRVTSVDTRTSTRLGDGGYSSDTSVCGERRREVRQATAGLG